MDLRNGRDFREAPPQRVADFLRSRKIENHISPPDRLHLTNDGRSLFLRITNGRTSEFPVRKTWIYKLAKWFFFPVRQLHHLNVETVTAVLNDLLLNIHTPHVRITIEDGEALTITSDRYTDFSDLKVLEICTKLGIESVTRTDFFLRVFTQKIEKIEVRPGDICGFGFNIFNSETGFRALAVNHFLFRYICSNGAVIPIKGITTNRAHYATSTEKLGQFLEEEIRKGVNLREGLATKLHLSAVTKASDAEKKSLETILRRTRQQSVHTSLRIRESQTRYDLFNIASSLAQSLDPSERLMVEEHAGKYVSIQPAP